MVATFKSFHPCSTSRGCQLQPQWIRFSLVAVGWLFWSKFFWVSDICVLWNVVSDSFYQSLDFFQWTRSNEVRLKSPLLLIRLTVVEFTFQWECQVSLSISSNQKNLAPFSSRMTCSFVNESTAFAKGLVSIQEDGTVIMKADDTTDLASGVFRDRWVLVILLWFLDSQKVLFFFALSVRITSVTTYNNGLFVLDLNTAPWGCGTSHTSFSFNRSTLTFLFIKAVWPAFWTVGGNWPTVGPQTILELCPYLTTSFSGRRNRYSRRCPW